jgi:hypothetical protein
MKREWMTSDGRASFHEWRFVDTSIGRIDGVVWQERNDAASISAYWRGRGIGEFLSVEQAKAAVERRAAEEDQGSRSR